MTQGSHQGDALTLTPVPRGKPTGRGAPILGIAAEPHQGLAVLLSVFLSVLRTGAIPAGGGHHHGWGRL